MAGKPIIGIDLDGTVLDCRPRQEAVLLTLIPAAEIFKDALWLSKRNGLSTLAALGEQGLNPPDGFIDKWLTEIESPENLLIDRVLPGVRTALTKMSHRASLILITARQNPQGVTDVLARLRLAEFFVAVEVVTPGKNAAEAKSHCLRNSGAILHCGDSEVDDVAARDAGIPFWAVSCGQRSKSFLTDRCMPARVMPSLVGVERSLELGSPD